jgi:hypothetical protein
VTLDSKIWIPSLEDVDWDDPCETDRRRRARRFAKHTKDNETWRRSEWEVDAWSDIFCEMKDDPLLAVLVNCR